MKNYMKTMLVAGLISLSVTMTGLAATTVRGLADDVSKEPNTFYTLYLGMSPSDFHENWDGIAGWTEQKGYESSTYFNTHRRDVKLDGKKFEETVGVTYSDTNNLYYISHRLFSNDVKALGMYYFYLYSNCSNNYPGFNKKVPYDPVPRKGLGHSMTLSDGSLVTLDFFKLTPHGQPLKYKYYVGLTYASKYGKIG